MCPTRSILVRTKGDKAFITVKGETDSAGKRLEFEYEIPLTDAREMLGICAPYPIEKTRYHVNDSGFSWEIDEFHGHNHGLVIAEIEGTQEVIDGALKARPAWLGEDVTTSFEYANARLSERPFTKW